MHGPTATLEELPNVLIPREDGGVLHKKGVVDYSIGKGVAPGVFCVVETRHPRVLERMIDLKMGKGPYFTLYRPYHLTSLEVPLSAARAVLYKQADMQPLDHPVAEAVALAKRSLSANETMGMIGENDYRGFAMTWADARARRALPIGIAERAKVVKPIKAGDILTYDNCVPDDSMAVTQIRRRLDQADSRFVTDAA
jgi:predicted homoserine dehydrogenase-like protein